ncbi:class I mannose-6-phosphate isomerase [Humibacter sp. RRB41]|uniref:class I mannose-6-phosphate isomerase n=1 Tax=Humibacter sp. RRB41 TaxID=2919946 RepID=UPI001FAA70E0|nr:class I mannose-6-phosphate isomerase [Humibacter sp. RRB41]
MTTSRNSASDAMASSGASPVLLAPNRPPARPYRGGVGIERFRGIDPESDRGAVWMPEDFVASTTEVFAGGGVGLTTLENGTTLRDAVAADPNLYLGGDHIAAFGADPMLLVKLLDTRERLFVHYHPSTSFARDVLAHASGKTEAWIIVATDGPGYAYLGFSRPVSETEVLRWYATHDVDGMLAAMNRVQLAPGDTLFVPAGMPHSIGEGITLVELQQPVDLSIILERNGFPIADADALLGLDAATAFSDLDRDVVSRDRLSELSSRRTTRTTGDAQTTPLFPTEADAFFRADRIDSHGSITLEPDYSVLVVLDGDGELQWVDETLPLTAGATVLVPFGAGETVVRGTVAVLRCRPPAA